MTTELQRHLARCVLEALKDDGLSQAYLAERAGVTTKHLSHLLTGRSAGSLELWERLAVALGRAWEAGLFVDEQKRLP